MVADGPDIAHTQDALVKELVLDAETEVLDLWDRLMLQKIVVEYGRERSRDDIRIAINVGSRKGATFGAATQDETNGLFELGETVWHRTAFKTVTAIGTSWSRSSFFWAVTTTELTLVLGPEFPAEDR